MNYDLQYPADMEEDADKLPLLFNKQYNHPRLSVLWLALVTFFIHLFTAFQWYGVKASFITAYLQVLNGVRVFNCEVVRMNSHTAWVRHPRDGAIVKRHLRKHNGLMVAAAA